MKKPVLVAVIGIVWILSVIGGFALLSQTLLAAYDGESFAWLNRKVAAHASLAAEKGQPERDRQWYADAAERYSYRLGAFLTVGAAAAVLAVYHRRSIGVVRRYLETPDSAFNLGVLRATIFSVLLYDLVREPIAEVARLPNELYKWPALARWALAPVPIEPWYVEVAQPVAIAGCAFAAVGLFSRWSALLAVMVSYTLVGIPTLTGKVDHSHHVLIIAAIVALSRCGDGLSVDALIRRVMIPVTDERTHERRRRYGLPIRLTTIVLATVYFFPGFWKAAMGPGWFANETMANTAREIWFQREYFEPLLRVDQPGIHAVFGSLATIVFEVGFVFAVFFKWPRLAFAAGGIGFHTMIGWTLGIAFYSLQAVYVAFIDFRSLLLWVGRRVGPQPLTVYYDGNCGLCRRTISLLLELDWLGLLRAKNALNLTADDPLLDHIGSEALLVDMHAVIGDRFREPVSGYQAYQRIAWRLPMLWFVAPLLWLPPVAAAGRRVYRKVADSRACQVRNPPATGAVEPPRWNYLPAVAFFSVVYLGLLGTGFTKMVAAWPVACYPTFDRTPQPWVDWPIFEATTASGALRVLDDDAIRDHYGKARYVPVMKRFIAKKNNREKELALLKTLGDVWRASGEIEASDPLASITVLVGRYELVGPQRPESPVSTTPRLEASWEEVSRAEGD